MSSRPRVLIVDDERGIQIVLREVLDPEGYEVKAASDGQEALDVLAVWKPDVIVLDLMMPGMDGGTFREAQRSLPDGLDTIPVVALSGARDVDDRAQAMGAAAVILKPFDLDDVVATIRRVIESQAP